MTGREQDAHPTSDVLTAFVLGRLEDGEAVVVAEHLGVCETCQEAALAVPDDSMLSLLRPGASTPVPRSELLGATALAFEDDVPPELRRHARYQVLRRLGAGGMGVVYQCEHRLMGRTVAVKVINKGLVVDAEVVERFQREVRAAARLAHPNLVQAFDAEKAGELHFLVLEFIEGVSLDALVKREGPLPVDRACDFVRQAALGLAHAAAQGLVHRDVKPQNIMVTPQGQVKVMDFGLASISAERGAERTGEGGLTEAGQGLGTPDYIAPEQIRDARSADARADIYSLGCTFYFLLSGRPPFPKGNSAQKVAAHLEQQPEPLSGLRTELPAELVQVIDKMMAKDPARRYPTAAAVVAALEPWSRPLPPAGRKRQRKTLVIAAGMVGVLVLGVALAYLALGRGEPTTTGSKADPPHAGQVVEPGDAAPDLSKLVPLIVDDFSDLDKSHFPAFGPNQFGNESRCENGRLVMLRGPAAPHFNASPSSQTVEGDFACQVVGRAVAGEGGWAVALVTPNWDRALAVCLLRDGSVTVGDLPGGNRLQVPVVKVEPLQHEVIRPGDQRNTLLVVLRGGRRLEIYVNGVAICRPIQLALPLAPRVEPQIVTWSKQVEITQFKLWLLKPLAPLEPGEEKRAPDLTGMAAMVHSAAWAWASPRSSAADCTLALWVAKSTITASGMKPVIDVDFSNPHEKNGFQNGIFRGQNDRRLHEMLFAEGRYVIRHPRGGREAGDNWHHTSSVLWEALKGDVACRVVGRVPTERDAGWDVGLVTPKRDGDVAVRLRRDGTVEVGNYFWMQGPVTLVGPIRHPAIHSGDKDNTLLVVLRGGQTLEIYVNGAAVTRPIQLPQRLASVCPGVGLWERCGAPELKGRAEFRRFTVWQLPSAQAKP